MKSHSSHSKYSHIPTKKLKEILSTLYTTSDIGTDYGPIREELEQILLQRESRILEEKNFREIYEPIKYATRKYETKYPGLYEPIMENVCDQGAQDTHEFDVDFTNNFDSSINPPFFPYYYDKHTEEYIPYSDIDLQ